MATNVENAADAPVKKFVPKKQRRAADEPGGLTINSLMDAVTILLTFLLVSINMDPFSIKQNQYLMLAKSSVSGEPKDSLAITVTKKEITVDSKRTVPVECMTATNTQCRSDDEYGRTDNSYAIDKIWKEDASDSSFLLVELKKTLESQIETAKELHIRNGRPGEYKSMATIICDKDIPYQIIAQVVHTIGSAGIEQMRFAVIRDSSR
jgi:biopolymer transport protein ExbD